MELPPRMRIRRINAETVKPDLSFDEEPIMLALVITMVQVHYSVFVRQSALMHPHHLYRRTAVRGWGWTKISKPMPMPMLRASRFRLLRTGLFFFDGRTKTTVESNHGLIPA